jgi:hypothetical protein
MMEAILYSKTSFLQKPHGVTSQKVAFFILEDVDTFIIVHCYSRHFVQVPADIISLNFVPQSCLCPGLLLLTPNLARLFNVYYEIIIYLYI